VSARLHDMDGDGRQDLVVLMAQGDEGVDIYFDRADSWERRRVLRFPPVFGVSSLEVADFNDDGRPDLLIANGDNADFSYGLKPYHGLRIFTGAPDGTFHESWFYPLYGATRALTGDFNLDGQPDIAAIAFFADFESPHPESFVLLLQQSAQPLRFQPHTLPQSRLSRWLVLHSADVDADGDPDLLLGAFTFSPTPVPDSLRRFWREQRLAALLLRNRTR
ncbi:MAG: VCBS repeat-containing protein, partial [Bacteroidetes bacterium]